MAELEQYKPLEDAVLLGYYHKGENKVVPFWLSVRYFDYLILIAWKHLRRDDKAQDALSEVSLKLIEVKPKQRKGVLKIISGKVEASLVRKVKSKAIDLYRKDKPLLSGKSDEDIVLLIEQHSYEEFLPGLEARDQFERLKEIFRRKYEAVDVIMIDLLLAYGSGKLKPIAQEMELEVEEARKIRQRVMRRAKRILLQINQPYAKAS